MHFRPAVLCIFLSFVLAGCTSSEGEAPLTDSLPPAPVLSIPGSIQMPSDSGMTEFIEENHQDVLLYCWIPVGQYAESEGDLQFLGTLSNRGITAVPVQFNQEVRNAGQNQLNNLGIPVAVGMGDDSLKQFMGLDILPAAVFVRSTGEMTVQTGFGCAERAVRSLN